MKNITDPVRVGATRPSVAERLRAALGFAHLVSLSRPKRAKAAPAQVRPASGTVTPAPVKRPAPPRLDPDAELLSGPAEVVAARGRERARCAAILESPAGRARPKMAHALAFKTRATEAEAIALLTAQPAGPDAQARSRDRKSRNPHLGAGLPEPDAAAAAGRWDRTFAKAGAG